MARSSRMGCRCSPGSTPPNSWRCATISSRSGGSPMPSGSDSRRVAWKPANGPRMMERVKDRRASPWELDLDTLLDLLDEAVAANGDSTALSLRLDDGTTARWTYQKLDHRS